MSKQYSTIYVYTRTESFGKDAFKFGSEHVSHFKLTYDL